MLSDYTLDTENFKEIMEDAKNMVVSLYPEWTDFNYHDPGITMLELFSWIKEGQQYFLDQIGEEHKKRYLKLLGGSIQKRKASTAFVKVSTKENLLIAAGTKLKAGDVCFETMIEQGVFSNKIKYCIQEEQRGQKEIREYVEEEPLHIRAFGENLQKESCFYIGLEDPLPVEENVGLYVCLDKYITSSRNKITDQFFPMLELCYEFYSKGEWKTVTNLADTTYGLLEDGIIFFQFPEEMDKVSIHGKEAYYIRIRVEKSDIDVPPVIEKIHFNLIPVIQKDTWVHREEIPVCESDGKNLAKARSYMAIEGINDLYYKKNNMFFPILVHERYIDVQRGEVVFWFEKIPEDAEREVLLVSYANYPANKRSVGIGNGFPYQEFELPSRDIMQEDVEILVHEIGSNGGYSHWKRVEDFGASKPEDKHYIVDPKEGKLIFGDCERGMAPEGEIILSSFSETLGESGNVQKGTIDRFMYDDTDGLRVFNPWDACGGRDGESIDECFFRTRKYLKRPETAVTYKDYERYVMETPGLMIESCKAILAESMYSVQGKYDNTIFIVVKPKGTQKLSESYKKNILSYLENYRMIGTKIEIIAPRYISMEISLDVVTKPHFLDTQERIGRVVLEYFQQISECFGAVIVYSELYGIIDMLDCVYGVNEITMEIEDSKVTRTHEGNIVLPPNGIIVLKNVQYLLTMAD